MPPRWSRSNPLALAVLVCLYEKPMHPYEVAQTLRQRAKQESVRLNYGSLYDAVATEMTDWLTELVGTPAKEYPAFMAGLSFMPALDPDDALAALRRRAEMLTVKLASLRGVERAARDAGLPRIFALEAEYEEGQLVAEFKFVTS